MCSPTTHTLILHRLTVELVHLICQFLLYWYTPNIMYLYLSASLERESDIQWCINNIYSHSRRVPVSPVLLWGEVFNVNEKGSTCHRAFAYRSHLQVHVCISYLYTIHRQGALFMCIIDRLMDLHMYLYMETPPNSPPPPPPCPFPHHDALLWPPYRPPPPCSHTHTLISQNISSGFIAI